MACADITVTCLASGSSGNSLLVTHGDDALLIDAGVGVRTLASEMRKRGVNPKNVCGILITHEHTDHIKGAVPFARKYDAPLVTNPATLAALYAQAKRDAPAQTVRTNGEIALGSFCIRAVPTSHDAVEPLGFRVSVGETAIAYATDTGYLTPQFREACVGASLICVESNHDIHKLRFGPYPDYLKSRILSRTGHLSNNAACDFVMTHAQEHGPACFWFLHLSETNNTPRMAMNHWKKRLRLENIKTSPANVEIALRDVPSLEWRTRSRAVQLALF